MDPAIDVKRTELQAPADAPAPPDAALATVLSSIDDHLVCFDREWRYTYVNDAAARTLGLPREALLGNCIWSLFPQAVGNQFYREVHEALREQRAIHSEHYYAPMERWFENHIYPNPGGVTVFSADITERKRTEAALKEEERRFRATFDNAAVGIAHVALDGRWLRVNDRTCEITGYAREELLASTFMEITHPEDVQKDWSQLQRLIAGEIATYKLEKRYVRKDRSLVPIELTVSAARDEGGAPAYLISVIQDISDRRRTQEALALERERLAIALRAGRLGVYEWRVGDSDVWWSPEVYPVYGVDPAAFTPTLEAFGSLVHPEDREGLWRKTEESLAQRKLFSHEYRVLRPDGEVRWVANISKVAVGESGEAERIVGVAADVTERKEADRRKDDFLAMLGHELRNPLAPIRNAVHILRQVGADDPRAGAARDMIDRQTAHLSRLVDELLDVSRVSRGKIRLQREPSDLAKIVRDAVEDYLPIAAQRGLSLQSELPAGALIVDGDRTRLTQVMGNLLSNAIKFTDRGGRVLVRAWAEAAESSAVVEVLDEGIGMDAAVRSRLFEPFAQADRSLDRSAGGLGLGLALVKGLVELHAGVVAADSMGPGRGSTFTVRLPLAHADVEAGPPAAAPQPADSLRVLVIEDNRDAAESLLMLLEIAGHDAHCAHDGPSGIRLAREHRPHVVLCDIGLPGGMDGYAVARALRAQSGAGAPRLVALTGYGQEDDVRRARAAGFDDHLVKPAEFEAVVAALRPRPVLVEMNSGNDLK